MTHRIAFLLLSGLLCLPRVGFSLEAREIFKVAEPSVVVVLASDAKGEKSNLGSGVLISLLDVVTSCRIVESAADIVITQGSALRKGRLQYQDKDRDLCQVHIEDPLPSGKPAVSAASTSKLETGQDLFLISSPRGLERTMSRTMISGSRDAAGATERLIQLDTQLSGGSLGGGLFDQNGALVGILSPLFKQGDNASYAIPSEWIAQLAKRSPDRLLAPSQTAAPATESKSADKNVPWHPGIGDRWHYRLMDGRRAVGQVNVEVIQSDGSQVRERITKDGSPGFAVERNVVPKFESRAFLPSIQLPGGYKFFEVTAYFPPATVEESVRFPSEISGEILFTGIGKQKLTWATKTPRKERVRVPAGEFEAWKVEAVANYRSLYGNVRIVYKAWYSPDAQRSVKTSLDFIWDLGTVSSSESLELASMEKAP